MPSPFTAEDRELLLTSRDGGRAGLLLCGMSSSHRQEKPESRISSGGTLAFRLQGALAPSQP